MKTKIQKDKNYQIKKSSAQLHKINPSISNESLQEISSMEMQSLSLKILLNFTSWPKNPQIPLNWFSKTNTA
jgi:hypothetical protein